MKRKFPQDIGRVLAHLRRVFQRAGRGSMANVVRKLRLRRTFFSEKWSRTPAAFDVGTLLAALRGLDIEPARFFAELSPQGAAGELWEGLEPIEERATPATHRAVLLAYRRMREELGLNIGGAGDDAESSKGSAPPAGRSFEVSPPLGAQWLDGLDAQRQHQSETVISELAANLDQVEPTLIPRALGIWGSALRTMIEPESAAFVNQRALRLARAAGDSARVADLLQRRAHVIADVGDHTRALALTELAAGVFVRIGDQVGQGRALADCGMWLYYLERPQEAIQAGESALALLPESLPRSRFEAYVIIGRCCLMLRDYTGAQRSVGTAKELSLEPWDRGKLEWFEGSLCRKTAQPIEAEQHLSEAVEIFLGLHYGLAAQVVLELAQVYLEQDRPGDAWRACITLRRLIEPLQRIQIISGVLVDLLRLEAGGLSLDLVKRARAVIEQESQRAEVKARRAWRALKVGC